MGLIMMCKTLIGWTHNKDTIGIMPIGLMVAFDFLAKQYFKPVTESVPKLCPKNTCHTGSCTLPIRVTTALSSFLASSNTVTICYGEVAIEHTYCQ